MGGYSKGNLIGCGDIVLTIVVVVAFVAAYWYCCTGTGGVRHLTAICG